MTLLIWLLLIGAALILATRVRGSMLMWTGVVAAILVLAGLTGALSGPAAVVLWVVFAAVAVVLNVPDIRQRVLSGPVLGRIKKVLPPISDTEREAIEAGTTWWEADLFRGNPDWSKLRSFAAPEMTEVEQAYFDGPVEELCKMIDDWEITHELSDLPENVWKYLADQRFFGLNIPENFGGLGFSEYAVSQIVMKVASRSGTLGATVMVPNSLGPGELLVHYGTDQQKQHYLPRLARGEEIPCFGLTGPWAGSDAGAMMDAGIVVKEMVNGQEQLGFRVSWEKRYITLGPVATVLGLAFKAFDPDGLIGDSDELGITCALVPTDTDGVNIGRRHFPLNSAFQNGPNSGDSVFIPMDWIIGGQQQVGSGWRMLMESLAAGRGIMLPASGVSIAKLAVRTTGAYSRVREQFNVPIGKFEGVEEVLARMGGLTYAMDAARELTCAGLMAGEKPSVISAIVKYHLTDSSRQVITDAMDIHGGRGICLGPNNYLGRFYQQVPVGITVEGANILTRSLMIFGQGAMRCHPFLLQEVAAAGLADESKERAVKEFDELLVRHIGYVAGNKTRAFVYGISGGLLAPAPAGVSMRRYYRRMSQLSAAFSFVADVSLFILGGDLKRREKLSGRFADALSYLYLGSATLKHFENAGEPAADEPLVHWAMQHCLFEVQTALDGILRNFPVPVLGHLLRPTIFPLGRRLKKPSDRVGAEVAALLLSPGDSRDRLTSGIYITQDPDDITGCLEYALQKSIDSEELRRRLRKGGHGQMAWQDYGTWVEGLLTAELINADEAVLLRETHAAVRRVIDVDDFDPAQMHAGTETIRSREVA